MKRETGYGKQVRKKSTSIWISRDTHAALKAKARKEGRVVQWLADHIISQALSPKTAMNQGKVQHATD